jgi:hypothetical protein
MVMLLEIFCTLMVTSHFMKNIHKWKSNLVVTVIVTLLPYLIFKKLIENEHTSMYLFRHNAPLCAENKSCIHYSAVILYLSGILIWKYSVNEINRKNIFYYSFHSLPILAFINKFILHWNFHVQIITDIVLMYLVAYMEEEKIQFDRSNYNHVRSNLRRNLNKN